MPTDKNKAFGKGFQQPKLGVQSTFAAPNQPVTAFNLKNVASTHYSKPISSNLGFKVNTVTGGAKDYNIFGKKTEYVKMDNQGNEIPDVPDNAQFSEDAPEQSDNIDPSEIIERKNIYGETVKLKKNPILEFFDELKPMGVFKYMTS